MIVKKHLNLCTLFVYLSFFGHHLCHICYLNLHTSKCFQWWPLNKNSTFFSVFSDQALFLEISYFKIYRQIIYHSHISHHFDLTFVVLIHLVCIDTYCCHSIKMPCYNSRCHEILHPYFSLDFYVDSLLYCLKVCSYL